MEPSSGVLSLTSEGRRELHTSEELIGVRPGHPGTRWEMWGQMQSRVKTLLKSLENCSFSLEEEGKGSS